uniref:Odorant response abnormal protein 4 n=1 Tax=Ascaris suum TaxID=6253 RepID=F1L5B0_ASCSU
MIALDKGLEGLLDTYVKEHCERQKRFGLMATAAFLIGSKLDDDVYVAHIAVCPLPETVDDEAGDLRSRLVDAEWISDHGTRVLRLLPGGISIVGLLWLADKKLAIQARTMLVDALNRINKHSNAISSLGLRPADNKLALMNIETPLGRPQGYIVDCSRKGAEGWQTKLTFTKLEWIPVESSASINLSVPISDPSMMSNFERQFVGAIREWTEDLFSTDAVLIDGRLRHRDEPLRSKDKKPRGAFHPIKLDTFVSSGGNEQSHKGAIKYSFCVVELSADVIVRAAVPSKATVQNAVDAVKEHIVRTLCSRAELHYESTDVIEDEQKDRISVHQLPRVVCTPLPPHPAIIFSDFLFEGDSKFDAQESFKDYLSLSISPNCIEDDLERHLDEKDLAEIGKSDEGPGRVHRSSSSTSSHNSAATTAVVSRAEQLKTNYLALLSIMVALLAIAIYILLHSLGE